MTLFKRRGRLLLAGGLFAPLAIACGGSDDTGSDEDYVAAFCAARREFSDGLATAVKEVSESGGDNPERIAEPFEKLASDFDDMDPPEDLREWHDAATDQLEDTAERIKDDKSAGAAGRDPLTGMPEGPRARLRTQADDEPACVNLNVFES